MQRTYHSKLLLFGEYAIIKGSKALAVPHARYGGTWDWADKKDVAVLQQDLPRFAAWLENQPVDMDFRRFQEDLGQGLYFRANIPTGYGLGSSGALVAATYDRYARNPIMARDTDKLPALKAKLAALEGFFHASSSGIDPFISFTDLPVLLSGDGEISVLPQIDWPETFRFFLINTEKARQTGPLVQLFLEKCQSQDYLNVLNRELIPAVNRAIEAFMEQEEEVLFDQMTRISSFQLQYFREMIPDEFLPLWERGLSGDAFRIKLCGAGGGGYLLGMCRKDAGPEQWISRPWEWVT